MSEPVPTRVVLYSYLSNGPEAVAEFRWTAEAGVKLSVLDPEKGSLAQDYYDNGAPFDAERRAVSPDEGPAFMRALVQPSRSTYFRFVDESDESEA